VNSLKSVYIFCSSYGEIKRTLYLAERYSLERPVTIVIPGMRDLCLFFKEIQNRNALPPSVSLICFERYVPRKLKARGLFKLCHVIPDILNERRLLKKIYNKHFATAEDCDIFFCSRGFDGYLFYMVKNLSRKNRIINTSPIATEMDRIAPYFPLNVSGLARLIAYKSTFGWEIVLGKLPHLKGFIYMTDKFIAKTVDEFISWDEIETMTKDFDYGRYRVFATGRYRVMYFDDSGLGAGYIPDKEIYRRELKNIFDILVKYFPEDEIARKYHPSYPDDKTLITVGDILPDYIPAELLYDPATRLYLSAYSLSLVNVKEGLAVSIAKLITLKNKDDSETMKQRIIQMSKSEILFPATLEEFEDICARLKVQ
jgi:hypothetical protein